MQIHELTSKQQLDEGLLDLAKKAASNITATPQQRAAASAASAAQGLQKQGYGAGYQGASARWQDKLAELDRDPAVKQYVQNVAQSWIKNRPLSEADNIQPVPNKGLPTPAEQARFQAMVQQKAAQTAPTTPPPPAKPVPPAQDPYRNSFLQWSDAQLLTRDPTSNKTVKMDDVRRLYPDLAEKLNFTLEQIVTARGTAQEIHAVANYLKLATAGVRAAAQAQRNTDAQRGAGTVTGQTRRLNPTPEQLAALTKLSNKLGGLDNVINAAKKISGQP